MKDNICVWKEVAKNDEQKIKEGKTNITLSPDEKCYSCDGLDTACKTYGLLKK